MQKKTRLIITILVIVILLLPFIAMQFTDEVNWTVMDFVIAAALLIGTGFIVELVLRKVKKTRTRITVVIAIFIVFALIWAELAVGIFGTPIGGS